MQKDKKLEQKIIKLTFLSHHYYFHLLSVCLLVDIVLSNLHVQSNKNYFTDKKIEK